MITGDAPRFKPQVQGGNAALKQHLDQAGLRYEETRGHYGGPEKSLLVYGPSRDQMQQLGKAFGQEAVIYNEGPKRQFIYTAGPNEGQYHQGLPNHDEHWEAEQGPPDDYWTEIPGHGFLRLNFDEKMQPLGGVPQALVRHELGHRLYTMLKKVSSG